MKHPNFIIRIYGIFIDDKNGILVSDELVYGRKITKFPGGGLEYGEGTLECLLRELKEETGSNFLIKSHFYTSDFFVESVFHPGDQIISIYYLIEPDGLLNIEISDHPFDFSDSNSCKQSFRFIPVNKISKNDFTLVIDQYVANLLGASL